MKKRIWSIWLALVVSLVIVAPVWATILTVEVEGVVNSIGTDGGFALDGSVSFGTAMTGFCIYDSQTPDLELSEYNGKYALLSISMNIGNYTFTHNPTSLNPALFKVYTANPCYKVNSVSPRFDGTVIVDGLPLTYDDIIWHDWAFLELMDLGTSSYEYIPNDALPDLDSWPDLSVFDMWRTFGTSFYDQGDGYFGIYGEVTSLNVVPEPSTVFLLALGSLALLRKHNGKRKINGTESRFCASYERPTWQS